MMKNRRLRFIPKGQSRYRRDRRVTRRPLFCSGLFVVKRRINPLLLRRLVLVRRLLVRRLVAHLLLGFAASLLHALLGLGHILVKLLLIKGGADVCLVAFVGFRKLQPTLMPADDANHNSENDDEGQETSHTNPLFNAGDNCGTGDTAPSAAL